jgi:hypothetical protein
LDNKKIKKAQGFLKFDLKRILENPEEKKKQEGQFLFFKNYRSIFL